MKQDERSVPHRPERVLRYLPLAALLGAFNLGSSPVPVAYAADFSVNTTADAVDSAPGDGICADLGGDCTLRAAIMETNSLVGPDTVSLPAGTYGLVVGGAGEDAAAEGDLDITDALTLSGAGAPVTIVDARGLDRVFQLPTTSRVTIADLTVQNGDTGSEPGGGGGGIANGLADRPGGSLELTNVTLAFNSAVFGGGLLNGWGASASLDGVTVSYNSADYGGGIYTRDAGPVNLTNCTVSHNSAVQGGGGIDTFFEARTTLTSSTISNNSASFGGGILREFSSNTVRLIASIVADNTSGGDCSGLFVSDGYNLDSDGSCDLTQLTDLPGTDPMLGPLQDNGGPTETHALLPGSPAIDHIPAEACSVATDQRGVSRPQGSGCEVGAYEVAKCQAALDVAPGGHVAGSIVPVGIRIAHHLSVAVKVQWQVALIDLGGRRVLERTAPVRVFEPGDVVEITLRLRLPPYLESGKYTLELAVSGMRHEVGAVTTLQVVAAE